MHSNVLTKFCVIFATMSGIKSKIGLALSGGGTKGIAHAGVLKFLEEKNIRPSIISAASAGAFAQLDALAM